MNIRIRNYHTDSYGHVNNARYLEFLEEARWAFFEQHNLLSMLGSIRLPVAQINIRYRRPALEGDELHISVKPNTISPRLVRLEQYICLADGTTVATAEITLIPTDTVSGKSTRLPEALLHKLQLL